MAATAELPLQRSDGNHLESWVSFRASRNEREDWAALRGTGAHLFVRMVLPCHSIRLRRAWKLVIEVRNLLGSVHGIHFGRQTDLVANPGPVIFWLCDVGTVTHVLCASDIRRAELYLVRRRGG